MLQEISIEHPAWKDLISELPEATIFHHPAWIKNLRDCYGYKDKIFAEVEGDKVLAGIPLMEVRSPLTGNRLIALPFSDYCAPLGRDQAAAERLIASLIELSHTSGMPIEVRWKLPDSDGIKLSHDYVRHTACLDPDPDIGFKRIHHRMRKYLRSESNNLLRVEQGRSEEFLRCFYNLQLLTRRKHGLPAQPWKFFEGLGRNVLEKGLGFVLLAFLKDECLAGQVVLHWGDVLTLKYAASSDLYQKEVKPNYLLVWEVIRWGCAQGYKILDVGRSDIEQSGLREYKNRWGYDEEALDYSFIGCEPPQKRTEGVIGKVFSGVIQRSPLWLCKAAGDLLYAHFP